MDVPEEEWYGCYSDPVLHNGKIFFVAIENGMRVFVFDPVSLEKTDEYCLSDDLNICGYVSAVHLWFDDADRMIISFDAVPKDNVVGYSSTFILIYNSDGLLSYYYRYGDTSFSFLANAYYLGGERFLMIDQNHYFFVDSTMAEHEHTWDEGIIDTPASCTKEGMITYTCTVCNETRTEFIEATGHQWDDGQTIKEPTNTEEGQTAFTCTVCGEIRYEQIPKTEPDKQTNAGDVDGDGKVTSADARLALRASVKLEEYPKGSAQYIAADVTGDGNITPEDARYILRASVKLEDLSLLQKQH